YNNWASQEISIYGEGHIVEVEWIVGPIPIEDDRGKEIIMRYDTDIPSNGLFFTDANGRQVLQRKRDYRSSYNYTVYESVSGNYYPVASRIWVKDSQRQLTVLTGADFFFRSIRRFCFVFCIMLDRSQGGSSMHDGSVELMIHRRTLYDDSQGVGEPINETAYGQGLVVRGKHYLIIEPVESSASYHRMASQKLFMSPTMTFALPNVSYEVYSHNYHQTWTSLNQSLPVNVHLLTLDQLSAKVFLLRVEHYFETDEDAVYSKSVEI
ncbi:unnamed protein product, partial [Adineta ricciae]